MTGLSSHMSENTFYFSPTGKSEDLSSYSIENINRLRTVGKADVVESYFPCSKVYRIGTHNLLLLYQ